MSVNVGRSCSPASRQKASDSGSVAIISEYTGTIARFSPGSVGVKASVARMTTSARMVPRTVRTLPFVISTAGERS